MNQELFLQLLRKQLFALPEAERERCIEDYRAMIADRVEDGMTEEEAIAQLGSPEEIAEQILAEIPISTLVKECIRPKRRLRLWEIVLLILGAPLWLPLLAAAAAVAFSLLLALCSLVLALISFAVSLVIGGVAFFFRASGNMLMIIGICLASIGAGVLLCLAAWKLGGYLAKGGMRLLRRCFLKRESGAYDADVLEQEVEV